MTVDTPSAISPDKARFLGSIIESDASIRRVLEVGCALGVSSFVIGSAIRFREGAEHIILDPKQSSVWRNAGRHNLERADLRFDLREEGSEFALPRLAAAEPNRFDLVFIDGWHTFDHTMIDLFYATILLRVGGYVVIDDCNWPQVARAVRYFSRYPCYVMHAQMPEGLARRAARCLLWRYSGMVALKKISEDQRNWDWR